jgi:hypothetical protein
MGLLPRAGKYASGLCIKLVVNVMTLNETTLHYISRPCGSTGEHPSNYADIPRAAQRKTYLPCGGKATRYDGLTILAPLLKLSIPCLRNLRNFASSSRVAQKMRLAQYMLEHWVGFVGSALLFWAWMPLTGTFSGKLSR